MKMEVGDKVMRPQAKLLGQPGTGPGKEGFLFRIFFWGEHGPAKTLVSDFWAPDLWENEFLLFKLSNFVVKYWWGSQACEPAHSPGFLFCKPMFTEHLLLAGPVLSLMAGGEVVERRSAWQTHRGPHCKAWLRNQSRLRKDCKDEFCALEKDLGRMG